LLWGHADRAHEGSAAAVVSNEQALVVHGRQRRIGTGAHQRGEKAAVGGEGTQGRRASDRTDEQALIVEVGGDE
jgi:hypothetical protein